MNSDSPSRKNLRGALDRGETIVAPCAYDAMTARLLRHLGFNYLFVGGVASGLQLGIPERVMTMSEIVAVASSVARGVHWELPVIADAGAGYGEPSNVVRTVREFEDAGVAAIHIEDEVFPNDAARTGTEEMVSIDLYQQRLDIAIRARRSRDFVIIARTNALLADPNGREEAVRRAKAAVEVGVDAIMIPMVRDQEGYRYFRKAIPDIPMVGFGGLMGFGFEDLTLQDFQGLGYQILVYPVTTANAALLGIRDAYRGLMATGSVSMDETQCAEAGVLANELSGLSELAAVESGGGRQVSS